MESLAIIGMCVRATQMNRRWFRIEWSGVMVCSDVGRDASVKHNVSVPPLLAAGRYGKYRAWSPCVFGGWLEPR